MTGLYSMRPAVWIGLVLLCLLGLEIYYVVLIERSINTPPQPTHSTIPSSSSPQPVSPSIPSTNHGNNAWFTLKTSNKGSRSKNANYCDSYCDPAYAQLPQVTQTCGEATSPCEKGIISQYDILYPVFRVAKPLFLSQAHLDLFNGIGAVKGWYGQAHGVCPSPFARPNEDRCSIVGPFNPEKELVFTQQRFQRGQVVHVRQAVYSGLPDTSFGIHQCWEGSIREKKEGADYHWVMEERPVGAKTIPKAVLLLSPVTGGAYFQHFIDRGFSKLAQVLDLLEKDPNLHLIMNSVFERRHPIVGQIIQRMGLKDRVVHYENQPIVVDELIFTCIAPHYHPYSYQRVRQSLRLADPPLSSRKTMVYLSRKGNSRGVSNEADLIVLLEAQAKARGLELIVFQHKDYPTLDDIIRLFNTKASIIIGPHGGAFYNQLFAAPDTLLIELFPVRKKVTAIRWPEAIWWPAAFFNHRYYFLTCESRTGDIEAPLADITSILQKEYPV